MLHIRYVLLLFHFPSSCDEFCFQDPDAELDPSEDITLLISQRKASGAAEAAFRAVFEHGPKIELDHHLVYHARKFHFGSLCLGVVI